jgi:hypothetical protein
MNRVLTMAAAIFSMASVLSPGTVWAEDLSFLMADTLDCKQARYNYEEWQAASHSSLAAEMMGGAGAQTKADRLKPGVIQSIQECRESLAAPKPHAPALQAQSTAKGKSANSKQSQKP